MSFQKQLLSRLEGYNYDVKEMIPQGDYGAFIVCQNGQKLFAKTEKDVLKKKSDREYNIQSYLYNQGLPVPKPIIYEDDIFVMEAIEGETLFDKSGGFIYESEHLSQHMFQELGKFFRKLHSVEVPDFLAKDVDMNVDFGTWLWNVWEERVARDSWKAFFTQNQVDATLTDWQRLESFFPKGLTQKAINHNDTFPANYIFQGEEFIAAIDFGRVMIAHPLLEMVVLINNRFRFYDDHLKASLLQGYGEEGYAAYLRPEFLKAHAILSATQGIHTGHQNGDYRYRDECIAWLKETMNFF